MLLDIDNLNKNNINDILKEIRELKNSNKNVTVTLLNILIKLCQDLKKCHPEILYQICLTICEELIELTPKFQEKYLRIMYYVIHYLDEKKKYFKEISILLDFMLPSWTPLSTMDSSLHSNYETLFPLVYNITNSCMKSNVDGNLNIIQELLIKSLTIYKIGKSNASVISVIHQYINSIEIIRHKNNIANDNIYELYSSILDFLQANQINYTQTEFVLLIRFQVILMSLFIEKTDKLNEITLKLQNIIYNTKDLNNSIVVINIIRDLILTLSQPLKNENLINIQRKLEICTDFKNSKQIFNIFGFIIDKMTPEYLNKIDSETDILIIEKLIDILLYIGKDLDIENENAQKLYGKCSRCSSTCQSNLALYYLSIINTNVVKLGSNFRTVINVSTREKIQQAFESNVICVRLLKNNLCNNWDVIFVNTILNYYNYMNGYSKNQYENCLPMAVRFINVLLEYFNEDINNKTMYKEVVRRTLHVIKAFHFNASEYDKCFDPLVLLAVLFGNVESLELWVTVQMNSANYTTMIEVLKNNVNSLKILYPNFNLDNLSLVSIALLELRVYNTYGHLQEPMIKCCKFVLENTDCDYMKTRVLQMLCLVGIPLDDPLWSQLNSFIEFLSTQAVKGDKSTANNRLILANLYILKYSSIIQNLMKQKINELLFSGVNTVDEIPCDGVSIRNEEDNFKNIEMSISNWLIVLDTKHDLTDEINDYNTLKIIYHLINVTELHNHSIYTIQLILILYRMSLFAKNSLYQMRALIYLLKYVQCSELYTQIVDEGKHILKNLYKDDNNKNSDKCYLELSFLLNQSYNLLMRKQFTEGYQILKIAQDEFNESDMEIQHSRIFRVQIDFLRLKYYNLPCEISVDQEHNSLLSQTSECYEFIAALLKRTSQRNEQSDNLLRILQYFIEISQWIINLYLNLNQPRESRLYIKNILKMLSTLNLPLRYAQMLCLQSKIDIMRARYNDSLLYFNKMLNTLCIFQNKCSQPATEHQKLQINEKIKSTSLSVKIDTLLDNQIRIPKITINTSPSIPQNDQLNYFLPHSDKCLCFLCTNYLYQKLCFESYIINSFQNKFDNYDYLIEDIQTCKNNLIDKMRNKSTIQMPSNFQFNSLHTNIALMEIENDMQITYHKFLIKICNELFINGNDHEKALKILTNSLSTLDNDELVPQILSLICKILYTSSASNEKVKLKSVSICTPEKRTPPSLLFATPSARIEKFLKSRTPGLTPATKFKIYTPKTEKINRLPVKSDDNERILTPKPKKSLRKVDDSIKKDANKARKNILEGDNKNMDLTLEINKNDTNSSHNGNELWSIQTGDESNIKTPTTNKFFKHHDFSDTYKSKTEKINRLPSKSKIKLPTIQYSDVYDQIHSPEQKKSVRKVYKSIKKGAIKALQSDSTDSSSEVLDLDGDDDVFTINNNKTPCTNKFFKSRAPGSILTYKKKIHTPKTEKIDRLSIESDNKLPTFTNSDDSYRTPVSKNSIRKIKKKQITEGKTSMKVNDKEKVVSSNSTENDSTDLSSEKTDLDGDDDVSIKVIKTCLDTKIKNDGKNKQVRNKSAVKSQTGDFCATSIDICDNLAVNKCLNYKHTYSKSSVNDHLSEQLSNLTIEKNSEMTHSSPAKQKIKPKTALKRNTTKDEEKDEHNSEIESRRILTRRAKKMESLELMETETNNDNKSLEKSSVDVPSPKVQKKIVKTTTKKVSKAKLKPNSSPNSSESVPKPRRKPKNPFIL